MKKFIFNILFFLFLLVFINALISLIVGKAYFKDYSEVSLNYNSYLLADSHGKALKDFINENGVFNFSCESDSYFDMLRKLRFLIRNTKVNRVILTVDDYTLSRYREIANNLDRSVVYTSPEDFDHKFDFIKDRYLKRYIFFFNPKSRDIMKAKITEKYKQKTGKKDYNKPWNELNEQEKLNLANFRDGSLFQDKYRSEDLVSALEKIISLCRSNKIELIGIKFPSSHYYYSLIRGKSFNADSLVKNKGFRVFDFTTIYRNNDDYFHDPDHLNEHGGKIFADTLLKSIQKQSW